jgi:hypothetical protein
VLSAINSVNQTASNLEGELAGNSAIALPGIATVTSQAPAAGSVQAPSSTSSGSQVSSDSTQQSGSTQNGSTNTDDTKKRTDDATHQACQAPGGSDGLGDVTGPLAKVFCD